MLIDLLLFTVAIDVVWWEEINSSSHKKYVLMIIFGSKINQNSQFIDKELLHSSKLIEDHRRLKNIGWSPPPPNMFKVNVDGSYNINYDISARGCLIQDVKYHLIREFVSNLRVCTAFHEDLCTIMIRVKCTHEINLQIIIFKIDYDVAASMIHVRTPL